MKRRVTLLTPVDAFNLIKLCYILIIVVCLFGLKLAIYPEGEHQLLLAIIAKDIILESICYATIICSLLSYVIFRASGIIKIPRK